MPAADVVDLPDLDSRVAKEEGAVKKAKRPAARKAAKSAGKKRKPIMRHGRDGVRALSKRAKPS